MLITRILQAQQKDKPKINKAQAEMFVDKLFKFLFNLETNTCSCAYEMNQRLKKFKLELSHIIYVQLKNEKQAELQTERFFSALENIYLELLNDAQAMFENDPAAQSLEEIYLAYPGFFALSIHRFSHQLWKQNLQILARLWAEFAHSRTGIDIHPAARIGQRFCIDHGTGIVIGETCIIGNNVKIYQGVTLGALSVSKDKAGTQRHPCIGDGVIIYSGATILGGHTFIGHDSIIGGNVWLTESIDPYTIIYYKSEVIVKQKGFEKQPIFFDI